MCRHKYLFYPVAIDKKDISLKLQQGTNPAFLAILQRCSVLKTKGLIVIQAKCVAKTPQK